VLADDHALVDLRGGPHEQLPPLLQRQQGIRGSHTLAVRHQRPRRACAQLAGPRLVALEHVVQLSGAPRLGQELGAKPDQPSCRRLLISRAGSVVPLRPASGGVLTPTVIDGLGSSTCVTGRGRGSSGSASVSPMVPSGMPATAMISPGPASSTATRSSASATYSSETLTRSMAPSARHHATCWPRRMV